MKNKPLKKQNNVSKTIKLFEKKNGVTTSVFSSVKLSSQQPLGTGDL